ncbi:putative Heparanase [Hibiscus syriacus]|uniref:Heparanase n=1 Tax=Hibiscus syriacus TaxID=106335 RepID=A0A6A3CMS6_HIBSY|nr:putative Heparanase [Hibiscus syriacus]
MSSSSKRCLKLLEKCKNMKQLKQAHAQPMTCGIGTNTFALCRLLAFCSNPEHESLTYACNLFKHIQKPTICICNTMIKAFFLKGETLQFYSSMLSKGIYPDNYTLPFALKACAKLQFFYSGELIYGHCLQLGFVFDIFVGNALISMYCGFNNVKVARCIFDEIPRLDVVSWTVMISGYVQMGDIDTAKLLFNEAPVKDRGIWGGMISGYVKNNCFKEGLYMFRLMQMSDIEPDEAICVSVISACANISALDTGIWIHKYMDQQKFPLSLSLSACLEDIGLFEEANQIIQSMSDSSNPSDEAIAWRALLSSYCNTKQTKRAEFAAEKLMQLEDHSSVYVLLSNLYASSGKHYDAKRIKQMMKNRGVNKAPGCSSIKIIGEVHEFIAGENSHLPIGGNILHFG